MAGTQNIPEYFTFGGSNFATEKVAKFFETLRAIGMEGRHQLPRLTTIRQFVICGVFTREELEAGDHKNEEVDALVDHLLRLDAASKDGAFGRKFIRRGRLAVLLNCFGQHGETRLFDPDRSILRDIGVESEETASNAYEKADLLKMMKRRFRKLFGARDQFVVLFSHLIPCTIEGHRCSHLLREYAERNSAKLLVSYDNTYHETNTREALTTLTHDNIYVMRPQIRRHFVNKDIVDIQYRTRGLKRLASCDNEADTEEPDEFKFDQEVVSKRQRVREKAHRHNLGGEFESAPRDTKQKKWGGHSDRHGSSRDGCYE